MTVPWLRWLFSRMRRPRVWIGVVFVAVLLSPAAPHLGQPVDERGIRRERRYDEAEGSSGAGETITDGTVVDVVEAGGCSHPLI